MKANVAHMAQYDFSKTFKMALHFFLKVKLRVFCFKTFIFLWVNSFFVTFIQSLSVPRTSSASLSVPFGIAQGYVFNSAFFMIYVNVNTVAVIGCRVAFANDIRLSVCDPLISILQGVLQNDSDNIARTSLFLNL